MVFNALLNAFCANADLRKLKLRKSLEMEESMVLENSESMAFLVSTLRSNVNVTQA